MRVITKKRLVEAGLSALYRIIRNANWKSLNEVRQVLPTADLVTVKSGKKVTVLNAHGNNDRVIIVIHYNTQTVFILLVLDHETYSNGRWKEWL